MLMFSANFLYLFPFSVIQGVFPCFIRAPSDSNAKPIDQLYTGASIYTQLAFKQQSINQSINQLD